MQGSGEFENFALVGNADQGTARGNGSIGNHWRALKKPEKLVIIADKLRITKRIRAMNVKIADFPGKLFAVQSPGVFRQTN
jgi:hypothetical protein